MKNNIAVCDIYPKQHEDDKWPAECAKHDYPYNVCIIGCDVLGIPDEDIEAIRKRGKLLREFDNPFIDSFIEV